VVCYQYFNPLKDIASKPLLHAVLAAISILATDENIDNKPQSGMPD
jgi:hypothetical protein